MLRGEKGRSVADTPDRYCGNCGRKLSTDVRFCPNCGRPVHETATVPTPEADVSLPPPQQAQETSEKTFVQKWWPLLALVTVAVLYVITPPGGGGGGDGNAGNSGGGNGGVAVAEKSKQEQHKQVIERGKAARNKEQQPSTHAPLPKGDTLEVYYRTTGGAGYEAYAGADGITRPVYFTGPHYADEHLLYHTDHNPGMTIDVTRMTTSGTVEVKVVHDGKQIAYEVANDSNHNVTIMGGPQALVVR
jgi:hypothetical protein